MEASFRAHFPQFVGWLNQSLVLVEAGEMAQWWLQGSITLFWLPNALHTVSTCAYLQTKHSYTQKIKNQTIANCKNFHKPARCPIQLLSV